MGAQHSTVPVINALSELHHPLQTLADLLALEQRWGRDKLRGKTLAWVGDGNNVLHDLMLGAVKMGMKVRVATPEGYEPDEGVVAMTKALCDSDDSDSSLYQTTSADDAVHNADVVVTDTWVSMGQEDEYQRRVTDFAGYQVNKDLMNRANDGAVFLHCLPRHPEEVADEVFYDPGQSLVWNEA